MKVVVAIDSLKGSLSSIEAGNAIKEGILRVHNAEVVIKPLADGGEGTTEALVEGYNGIIVDVEVVGPIGKPVNAKYGLIEDNTAVLEMASASGITLITRDERNPMEATTFGVGQMIVDAIKKGCRNFIVGIGGSATNDGGVGMLQALGFEFFDNNGNKIGLGGKELSRIDRISNQNVMMELADCKFKVACDVNNPLCFENGATYIYGPQKGVTEDIRDVLDNGMLNYANVTEKFFGVDNKAMAGAGAAGGLGFAFVSYLGATLTPGIDLILDAIKLEDTIIDADIVITGEGRLDIQSAMGKAPIGVAKLAKKYDKKVIAFAGGVTNDAKICNEKGIDAFFPIVRGVTTLEEAMVKENAYMNMADTVEQVFRLIK